MAGESSAISKRTTRTSQRSRPPELGPAKGKINASQDLQELTEERLRAIEEKITSISCLKDSCETSHDQYEMRFSDLKTQNQELQRQLIESRETIDKIEKVLNAHFGPVNSESSHVNTGALISLQAPFSENETQLSSTRLNGALHDQNYKAYLETFLGQKLEEIKHQSLTQISERFNHQLSSQHNLFTIDYNLIVSKITPSISAELVSSQQTLESSLRKEIHSEIHSTTTQLVSEKCLQMIAESKTKNDLEVVTRLDTFENSFRNAISSDIDEFTKKIEGRLQSQLNSTVTNQEVEDKFVRLETKLNELLNDRSTRMEASESFDELLTLKEKLRTFEVSLKQLNSNVETMHQVLKKTQEKQFSFAQLQENLQMVPDDLVHIQEKLRTFEVSLEQLNCNVETFSQLQQSAQMVPDDLVHIQAQIQDMRSTIDAAKLEIRGNIQDLKNRYKQGELSLKNYDSQLVSVQQLVAQLKKECEYPKLNDGDNRFDQEAPVTAMLSKALSGFGIDTDTMNNLAASIEKLLAVTESLVNSARPATACTSRECSRDLFQNAPPLPDIMPLDLSEQGPRDSSVEKSMTPAIRILSTNRMSDFEDSTRQVTRTSDPALGMQSQSATTPMQLDPAEPASNFPSDNCRTPRSNVLRSAERHGTNTSTPRSGRVRFHNRGSSSPEKPRTDSEKQEYEILGQAMQSFIYFLARQNQQKSPSLPRPTPEELTSLKPLRPIDSLLQENAYTLDEYSSLPVNAPNILLLEEVKQIGFVKDDEKKLPYIEIVSENLPQPFDLHAHCQKRARQYGVKNFSWADESDDKSKLWNLRMAAFCVDTFITACEQQCFTRVHAHQLKTPTPSATLDLLLHKLKHRIKSRNREEKTPGSIMKNQQLDRRYHRRQALRERRKYTCHIIKQLNPVQFLFEKDYFCSDDESDDEDRMSRTRIAVPFRSKSATRLVERIDQISDGLAKKQETRRPGPPPAKREPPRVAANPPNARPPVGFPRDMYDDAYLSSLTETQREVLEMKDDFFTPEMIQCIYKPLPIEDN